MNTTRTRGMALLAFACLLTFSATLYAEEGTIERTDAIFAQLKALRDDGKGDEAEKLLASAVEEFQNLVKTKPKDAQLWVALSQLQAAQEKTKESEQSLREALRLEPNNVHALSHLGRRLIQRERWDEAIPLFRKAIEFDDADAILRRDYGIALWSAERLEEAEAQLRLALHLDAKDSGTIYFLSTVLLQLKRTDEALQLMNRGIELYPQDPKFREILSLTFEAMNKLTEAYAAKLELGRLQPTNLEVEKELILLASKMRQFQRAELHIARLRELQISQKQWKDSFTRDKLRVGLMQALVEEQFEVLGDPGIKYTFHVHDRNGIARFKIHLATFDALTKAMRDKKQLRHHEQAFALFKQDGPETELIHIFHSLPNYAQVRAKALGAIDAGEEPQPLPPLHVESISQQEQSSHK